MEKHLGLDPLHSSNAFWLTWSAEIWTQISLAKEKKCSRSIVLLTIHLACPWTIHSKWMSKKPQSGSRGWDCCNLPVRSTFTLSDRIEFSRVNWKKYFVEILHSAIIITDCTRREMCLGYVGWKLSLKLIEKHSGPHAFSPAQSKHFHKCWCLNKIPVE